MTGYVLLWPSYRSQYARNGKPVGGIEKEGAGPSAYNTTDIFANAIFLDCCLWYMVTSDWPSGMTLKFIMGPAPFLFDIFFIRSFFHKDWFAGCGWWRDAIQVNIMYGQGVWG